MILCVKLCIITHTIFLDKREKNKYNILKENSENEKDNILSIEDYTDILVAEYKKLIER